MKTFSILTFFLILSYAGNPASSDSDIRAVNIDAITAAISSGNSKELAKYFSELIDLSIPDKEGNFSKAQAEIIMKDFFSKNPPKSFSISNQGASKGGAEFYIGTMTTAKASYRIYFIVKPVSGKDCIQQLQIDAE